jgi:hypothetical protein
MAKLIARSIRRSVRVMTPDDSQPGRGDNPCAHGLWISLGQVGKGRGLAQAFAPGPR